ncbi:hypothetical protein F5884DRAFT_777695 [Xylogone sp. PMI_703]|nr:hypothetical protein F5884DRAFT_777695 [Xylogone sp. PMI_703]
MDSTRRSSRAARASQTLQSTSHHSSSSSNSSSRAVRSTRSHHKTESPRKSTPSRSLSSESLDDGGGITVEDSLSTRRRKRGQNDEREKATKSQVAQDTTDTVDEIVEDDEAVRCICGYEDYPGPPPPPEEDSKNGIKDGIDMDPVITVADVSEDLAGFFLQCDICKVWQHGGCVGIMNEDTSPEEYFCEECRKDLHKIYTAPNGQRYSHYLPLYQNLSRTTSRAASFSKDGTRSPKGKQNGRPSSSVQSSKRRSTMNSRDAAYDEEEELRRVLEISKEDKTAESIDTGSRRTKRGRSDSEEKLESSKRQRTASISPSPTNNDRFASQTADSDDGINGRSNGSRKVRGAAARNHKEKEMREERERSRQEAANKRKGRAERRRAEDSDAAEELPLAARSTVVNNKTAETPIQASDPPASVNVVPPDTPPAVQTPVSNSHKKGGRPPNSRKGKLGKNQYTKDKDLQDGSDRSPHRSQSRDVTRDESIQTSGNRTSHVEGKPTKSKGSSVSKITMGDMKKRVAAMLDFISRTQVEMAGDSMSASNGETEKMMRSLAESLPASRVNGESKEPINNGNQDNNNAAKDFRELSCLEMMDVLTRQLVKWQKEFT